MLPLSDSRLCSQGLGCPVTIHTQGSDHSHAHDLIAGKIRTDGSMYFLWSDNVQALAESATASLSHPNGLLPQGL